MKKILSLILLVFATTVFVSCEDEVTDFDYASFEAKTIDLGVEQGGEITRDIKVYTSKVTSSDRTVGISVVADMSNADPASYTVAPSVTIPAGSNEGVLTVKLKDIGLDTDKTLVLKLDHADGFVGENLTLGLAQLCPNNGVKMKMTLTFDDWPEEAAWRIRDANGVTVMASATPFNYGAYGSEPDGSTLNITPFCLASGTYTFQAFDRYSDGGTVYTVTANGATVVSLSATGYTNFYTKTFSI